MNSDKRLQREKIILERARCLIKTNGFDKTSMQQIAVNCGLAVGTLYNYFPSKNDILINLFKNEIAYILECGEPIAEKASSNLLGCFSALFKEYSKVFTFFDKELWIKFLADVAVKVDVINVEGELWKYFENLCLQIKKMIVLMKEKSYIRESVDERILSMLLFNMFYFHLREYVYSAYTVEKVMENLEKQIDILVVGIENSKTKKE